MFTEASNSKSVAIKLAKLANSKPVLDRAFTGTKMYKFRITSNKLKNFVKELESLGFSDLSNSLKSADIRTKHNPSLNVSVEWDRVDKDPIIKVWDQKANTKAKQISQD